MRNLVRAFTLSLAMLGIHTNVALAARWTEVSTGLTGAVVGVRMLVIDRATGSTLYALTSRNGIFRSIDAGASWKAVGNIAGVLALALDPTSPLTIYAGTGRGVFKSTNGGESWNSAGLSGMSVSILAVDPITPSTLYAGLDTHIQKSTDGGGSWTALGLNVSAGANAGPPFIGTIILDPLTPSTLYVLAGGPGSAIYKSTDGGASWNAINPGPFARLLAIDPTAPSTLYAIRFVSGLSKSTDGGANWTATGFTNDVLALAVDPANSNILYASTSGPGQAIFKSTDGGKNWNAVNTSLPPVASLVLSRASSSTIYAATFSGGIFKSTDAGTNWNETNTGLRVLNIGVLVADPVDPAIIYAGGDDGLFESIDSGTSWNQRAVFQVTCCAPPPGLPPGLPPPPSAIPPFPPVAPAGVGSLLIDFANPNVLYVGAHRIDGCFFADINLFKSTDGGATWSDSISPKQSGCLADALMAMDPTDPNALYLRYGDFLDGYGLLKSTDGGATWISGGLGADALNALVIDPTNPAILYAGTDTGVFRTTDGGASWSLVGLAQENVNLVAIDPFQPNVLYAGTSGIYPQPPGSRGLFKSTDSGANWSPVDDGLKDLLDTRAQVNALIVDPDHTEVLYLATSGYGVFKSADGGATWEVFNDGLTHLDVRALGMVRGDFPTVYAGTPGGVFKIVEDGQ
jgi:photosystem II stability/assembly factor-like uncharacterized protein